MADTREKCLSILLACFALTLPETEVAVQAILETIDSGTALSSTGTSLSSTILPVGERNLPLAPVNAVNVKADKLLAKYQKQLRDTNDMIAAHKKELHRITEPILKYRRTRRAPLQVPREGPS